MKTHKSSVLISVGVLSMVLLLVLAMNSAPPITSAKGSQGSKPTDTISKPSDLTPMAHLPVVVNNAVFDVWSLFGNSGTNPATHFLGTTDSQPLIFRTNNLEHVRIDANGNLGIGTTSPLAKAEVVVPNEGDLALRLQSGTNAFLDVKPTTTGSRFQTVLDTVNSRDIVLLPHSSNVGIGQITPTAKLDVVVPNEGDPALRLESGTNAFLDVKPTTTGVRFQTVLDTVNSRDIVLQPHNGNVGIGQISPAAKLEVVAPNEGELALRLDAGTNAFLDVKPTNTGGRFQTVLDTVNSRDIVLLPHSGNVVIASGNVTQTLDGSGTVKAGVYAFCDDANSLIVRQFNNVNNVTLTISNGPGNGQCTIDFKFDVSNRFINVTAFESTASARAVAVTSQTGNTATFLRFNGGTGSGAGGYIYVLVY